MGILNKFKNMFTEEIEEEIDEPVKKEMISVEIPSPLEREKKEVLKERVAPVSTPKVDRIPEKREVQSSKREPSPTRTRASANTRREEVLTKPKEEEKFTFPVFFDDDDFDTLDKKKEKKEERKVEPYGGKKKEVKKEGSSKKFKPTPIISPIYGVLDKNYTREDITNKVSKAPSRASKEMTIDDLRKKAYGTLEDDLESGLLNDTAYDKPAVFRGEDDMFDDLNMFDDTFVSSREARNAGVEENMVKQEIEKNVDQQAETDLFNLIDSMYEKGDES